MSGDNFRTGTEAIFRLPVPDKTILKVTASFTLTDCLLRVAFRSSFPTTPEKSAGLTPGNGLTLILTVWLAATLGTV